MKMALDYLLRRYRESKQNEEAQRKGGNTKLVKHEQDMRTSIEKVLAYCKEEEEVLKTT